jgi:hypothetical protein
MNCGRWFYGALGALAMSAEGAVDFWDLPPLRYSDSVATDPIARLAGEIAAGRRGIEGATVLDRLRTVLKLLGVPEESQVLVFSKTSKQNGLIHPGNPRCLFFNERTYVGFVPGGEIEVITYDPVLGPVFYLIETPLEERSAVIDRDTSSCLSCHGNARTEGVPGVLVRSVFPDEDGHPVATLGSFLIDHRSPISERWGGYYVTGKSSLPHLGNRTFAEEEGREEPTEVVMLEDVRAKVDAQRYLRVTSDIVALLVLEHQCRVHNLITAASMQYRRGHWLQKALDPAADPDEGSAGRMADEAAKELVDALLFKDEAELGENGVEGDVAFQDAFSERYPRTKDGKSLADFQLQERIFKLRCSYMVYSQPFQDLPPRVKGAVMARLKVRLSGPEAAEWLKEGERGKIAAILAETLEGW